MEDSETRKETSEIVEMIKLGSVIVVLLLLFKLVTNNAARALLITVLYVGAAFLFHVGVKTGVCYFVVGAIMAASESIFIRCFSHTWDYRKFDIPFLRIPVWLVPLWAIAVLIIYKLLHFMDKKVCCSAKRPSSVQITGCPENKITYDESSDTFTCSNFTTSGGDCELSRIGGQDVNSDCVAKITLRPSCPGTA